MAESYVVPGLLLKLKNFLGIDTSTILVGSARNNRLSPRPTGGEPTRRRGWGEEVMSLLSGMDNLVTKASPKPLDDDGGDDDEREKIFVDVDVIQKGIFA